MTSSKINLDYVKSLICKNSKLAISTLVLAVIFFFNGWFLLVRGAAYIDSDMASNFIAAVYNNADHSIMSRNWYYSTGICLFTDVNIFQIVLLILKDNWLVARAVGVLIMQILLVLQVVFFSKQINAEWYEAVLFAAFSVAPISYWLLLMIGFGAYYIPMTAHSMLILAVVLWYAQKNAGKIKEYVCYAVLALEGTVQGICGIKSAIYPYGPLAITAAILLFLFVRNNANKIKKIDCFEWRFAIATGISLITYGIGFLLNNIYFVRIFKFEGKDEMVWGEFDINAVLEGVSECLSLMGYQSDKHVNFFTSDETLRSVFSLQGIANLFGLVLILGLILSVIRLWQRFNVLSIVHKTVYVLFLSSMFVGCVVYKLTKGYDTSAVYWVPVYPLMFIIIFIEIKTEDLRLRYSKNVLYLAITFCVVVTSISTIKLYQESPMHANPQLVNVVKWLQDNGYKKGYGSFWQCNSVAFLSNGDIEMWDVYGLDNLELHKWLQPKSHDNPPEGDRIFSLIGPKSEIDREAFLQYMNTEPGIPEIVYKDNFGYIVVEYK